VERDDIDAIGSAGANAVAAAFTVLLERNAGQAELITAQAERIAVLEAELEELKRLLGRNSSNSSKAPSADSPEAREQRPKKPSSGRKPGGQPGQEGHRRKLVENPDRVIKHWPEACKGCGKPLPEGKSSGDPVRHQVSEVVVKVDVAERQRMRVPCDCGQRARGPAAGGA
jgi:transposase